MPTDSILGTIRKMLGIPDDYTVFDRDLIVFINAALTSLHQLGVGPEDGYTISGNSETWNDLLSDSKLYENVKTYVFLKTRYIFDPPSSSFVLEAFKNQIAEIEWRITVQVDEDGEKDGTS